MAQGWIKIHRELSGHWLWDDRPFSRGQAWIDILLLANHAEKKILRNGDLVEIERGQFVTSILKLSERWGWGRKKTSNFLELLEKDGMITQKRTTQDTTITVIKYGVYQCIEQPEEQRRNSAGTTQEQPGNTNKNVKNDKNEKEVKDNMSPEYPYKDVIAYLNQRAGTAFRDSSKDSKKHIVARFVEGFTLDDFKAVVDKKVSEWSNDPDMSKYIRPSTLFGPKFEGYLNQPAVKPGRNPKNQFNNFEQRDYDYDDLERQLLASQGRKGKKDE